MAAALVSQNLAVIIDCVFRVCSLADRYVLDVQAYGVQQATDMCKRILAAGIPGMHLYTLNLERSAIAILENLEIIPRKVQCCSEPDPPDPLKIC